LEDWHEYCLKIEKMNITLEEVLSGYVCMKGNGWSERFSLQGLVRLKNPILRVKRRLN